MTRQLRPLAVPRLAALALVLGLLAPRMAWAQATPRTVVVDTPYETTVTGCGLTVFIRGTARTVFHSTLTAAGGVGFASQFTVQGTGVDQNGVQYQYRLATQEIANGQGNPTGEQTTLTRVLLISSGSAPNQYLRFTTHFTFANGETRVAFSDFSLECRPAA